VVDLRDGAVTFAEGDSPLRVTVTDVMKKAQPYHKALVGVVILAVARMAYPEPAMIDDPDRIAVFTTQGVVDALDRLAAGHSDEANDDSPADEDLVATWQRWIDLSTARPNAQRRSPNDRAGVVNKVCKLLVDAGYLTARSDTDGGTWATRPRFRHAAARLSEDSDLYRLVNGFHGTADGDPDQGPWPGASPPGGGSPS
jgi:hypothetical protein